MKGIIDTLNSMEDLIVKILVWVLYIPKTLIWIIFNPSKVRGYIHGELNPDPQNQQEKRQLFEGFIPPVVLLLVVALIPALLLGFLPKTGATITRPTETKSAVEGSLQSLKNRASSQESPQESYQVEAEFNSSAEDLKYIVTWWVEQRTKESLSSETQSPAKRRWDIRARKYVEEKLNDGQYTKIATFTHSELDKTGETIIKEDNNSIRDTFNYPFTEAGSYYINVTVQKVRPVDTRETTNHNFETVEKHTDYVYVEVPPTNNAEYKGYIDESRIKAGGASATGQRLSFENFSGHLKKESTIFLAICMLFPPLLFALVGDLVTQKGNTDKSLQDTGRAESTSGGNISPKEGGDKTLRETFYVECYYFSPLSLAIWAFYYSLFFFTGDVLPKLFGSVGIYIPLLAALSWFVVVETNALAEVNDQDKITQPVAFLIVLFNLSILAGLGILIFVARNDSRIQDLLRISLIRLYVIAGLGLLVAYFVYGRLRVDRAKLGQMWEGFVNRWKKQPQKQEQQLDQPEQTAPAEAKTKTRKKVFRRVIISLSVITVIFCCIPVCVILLVPIEDTSTAAAAVTQTPTAVLTSSMQLPEDTGAYYTEEFDGDLNDWGPGFLRGGEAREALAQLENGSLNFIFSPNQDPYPTVYKVNNAYEYTDVQIETTVKSNSADPSEAILVCQYSPEKGWYEFAISNTGEYAIYARDETVGGWTELARGSSPAIKPEKNSYQAICEGNKLSISINGTQVDPIQDTEFNFKQGKIGLGLFSPKGKAVDVSFESLKVSKPEITLPEMAATPGAVASGIPDDTSVLDSKRYYTEEFDAAPSNWGPPLMTSGEENQVSVLAENGSLRFSLSAKQDQFPAAYLINNAFNYNDVKIDALVKNNGNNSNGVSLICQYNEKGWYEFEISNSGEYAIYAFDAIQWVYTLLKSGYSNEIKSGLAENSYTAICKGNELALFVNGIPIQEAFQETTSDFTEGKIGIGLASPQDLPVDVSFESLKVSNPNADEQVTSPEPTNVPVVEAIVSNTPMPASSSFFTDEFDGNLDRWEAIGDQSQVKLPPEDGRLHFQLVQKDGRTPPVYFINNDGVYGSVQVEVVTTNNGNNSNGVDMLCHLDDNGWYEFEVSNSGEYAVYAYDAQNSSYTLLTSGSSPAVKTGMSENIYAAKCQGSELMLIINGSPVIEAFQETNFNFTEGGVGFGVTSRKGFPVDLYIESVKVSEP